MKKVYYIVVFYENSVGVQVIRSTEPRDEIVVSITTYIK